jgi:hypothetical protein
MIKDEGGTFFDVKPVHQVNINSNRRQINYPPDFNAQNNPISKNPSATDQMIIHYIKNAGRVI